MNERINQILQLLSKEKKIEVSTLSKKIHVSEVTIRKDLTELENRGIIKREYGYALLRSEEDINGRLAYHYETKRLIAAKGAQLVKDGDTIMIESGSCCALLAETLAQTKKNLTIITNSAFIAQYIRAKADFSIVLLGGIYQKDAQINVGPMVAQCAQNFLVDLFFIGTDGYDEKAGFTNKDQFRAQAVNDMALQADKVVVLTESEKFCKKGNVSLKLSDSKIIVITDSRISIVIKEKIVKKGIEVLIA